MITVESSNIAEIGHDGEKTLRVKFHKGGEWDYTPVSKDDFEEFKAAMSIGGYFHQHIKKNPGITAKQV